MIGFIKESNESPLAESRPMQFAKQLRAALRHHKIIDYPPNIKKWVVVFRSLIEERGEDEVERVLTWFCANIKKMGAPHIYSAAGFAAFFDRVKKAVDAEQSKVVELPNEVRKLIDEAIKGKAPPAVHDSLNMVLLASWLNYKQFLSKARAIQQSTNDRRLGKFINHLFESRRLCRPVDFVRAWMERQFKRVGRWAEWSGSPEMITFSIESKDFHVMGRNWSHEWSGSIVLFDRLMNEMSKK